MLKTIKNRLEQDLNSDLIENKINAATIDQLFTAITANIPNNTQLEKTLRPTQTNTLNVFKGFHVCLNDDDLLNTVNKFLEKTNNLSVVESTEINIDFCDGTIVSTSVGNQTHQCIIFFDFK